MTLLNRRVGLSAVALAALLGGSSIDANAQLVVSYFNFNALTGSTDYTNTINTIAPTSGNGSLSTTFTGAGSVTAFGGTTTNAQGSDVAGQALALVNQTNNGNTLTLALNTVSYTGITLSFATQRTATGFGPAATPNLIQYSVNNGAFTSVGNYSPVASFTSPNGLQTFDLSGVSALNNASNVRFRFTFNGASSAGGNNRIDNLKVTAAVPGPEAILTFAMGVPAVAMRLRRKSAKK